MILDVVLALVFGALIGLLIAPDLHLGVPSRLGLTLAAAGLSWLVLRSLRRIAGG